VAVRRSFGGLRYWECNCCCSAKPPRPGSQFAHVRVISFKPAHWKLVVLLSTFPQRMVVQLFSEFRPWRCLSRWWRQGDWLHALLFHGINAERPPWSRPWVEYAPNSTEPRITLSCRCSGRIIFHAFCTCCWMLDFERSTTVSRGPCSVEGTYCLFGPRLCEYLVYLCTHHGWQPASTVQDAAMLYRRLQTLLWWTDDACSVKWN